MPGLPFMPLDARFADVLGLIDTLANEFKGQADIFMIAKEMESDIDDLMPALNAAVYLGFVEVKGGDVKITDEGKEFLNAKISDRKKILRQKLLSLEPFHTAYSLGLRKPFTIDDLIEELNDEGYVEAREPGIRHLLEILLAEWGVFAGMLKKRGDVYIAIP
ncbi:nitrate/sulfonate/bicarbonate family ABC transporter ATPase [Vulcanisaeta moutnovskia 768-28]|uniref:Nitrate/sulfonate/bicarbonate family ABC transporter ATPase n=1 Tax=Vulcanisaeta moutnovskia (strain 768-28) TaxID=985053 RepID=F0QVZ6_VULM7|nr:AAA-associated domain-containing protein [Vulcanisaeta moutnovskia]ADY00920.1 nitrate/sulfonate/bicarbonate family ABC transporter ATPase [Vulcanisaeta moutnovskia 768-28]